MFKYICFIFLSCFVLIGCEDKKEHENEGRPFVVSDEISNDRIYFFTKDMCPYCNHAAAFIQMHYPDLKVEFKNIDEKENWELMLECVKKFNINQRQIGTPLICMGENFILGWSSQNEEKFSAYVIPFLKTKQPN